MSPSWFVKPNVVADIGLIWYKMIFAGWIRRSRWIQPFLTSVHRLFEIERRLPWTLGVSSQQTAGYWMYFSLFWLLFVKYLLLQCGFVARRYCKARNNLTDALSLPQATDHSTPSSSVLSRRLHLPPVVPKTFPSPLWWYLLFKCSRVVLFFWCPL